MKYKFLALILVFSMLIVPVHAENKIACEIKVDVDHITLSGKLPVEIATEVSVLVINPNKTVSDLSTSGMLEVVNYQNQTTSQPTGEFVFDYEMQGEKGIYTVKIDAKGFRFDYQTTFEYYGSKYIGTIIAEINTAKLNANDTNLKKLITNHYIELNLNSKIYTDFIKKGENIEQLYKLIAKMKPVSSPKDVETQLAEACLLMNIKYAPSNETVNNIINTFNKELNLENNSAYKTYCNNNILTNLQTLELCTNFIGKDYESADMFVKDFESLVILMAVNSAQSNGELKDILLSNSEIIKFSNIETYKLLEYPQEVFLSLLGKTFYIISDLTTAFDNAVVKQRNIETKKPSGGASNTGSTTGGFSSGTAPNMIAGELPKNTENQKVFDDLNGYDWALESITELYNQGVISSSNDKHFMPQNYVTREEFVKMLISAFGLLDKNATIDFDDVDKTKWYYPYIASGVEKEIIQGKTQTLFGTGENITREDMATVACRVILKLKPQKSNSNIDNAFNDFEEISDYAKAAVIMLSNEKIILGTQPNIFSPKDFCDRAQAAVVVYRLKNFVNTY